MIEIDKNLALCLVKNQCPQWKDLFVKPVVYGGWDNRTFHLGDHMLVRIPSAGKYALQIEKEYTWLPKLAPLLPLQIPEPLVLGQPACGYALNWSIYRWIDGQTVAYSEKIHLNQLAQDLAKFLKALHAIDTTSGPLPGNQNFYRGGLLKIYDAQVQQAITILKDKIDISVVKKIWESAIATQWQKKPVWVHGDIAVGNLLVRDGKLCAVIDFGRFFRNAWQAIVYYRHNLQFTSNGNPFLESFPLFTSKVLEALLA